MTISPQHIGAYIRYLRKKQGIKQFQLATAMGVTTNTVCSWEKGKTLSRTSEAINTIATLGGSIEELIQFEIPDTSSNSASGRGRIAKARNIIGTDRINSSNQDGVTE
jgi:transcriptional regulator with XRE-family HTH domain